MSPSPFSNCASTSLPLVPALLIVNLKKSTSLRVSVRLLTTLVAVTAPRLVAAARVLFDSKASAGIAAARVVPTWMSVVSV